MKYDSVLDQQSISGKIVSLILCVWKPCYVKSGHILSMVPAMMLLIGCYHVGTCSNTLVQTLVYLNLSCFVKDFGRVEAF